MRVLLKKMQNEITTKKTTFQVLYFHMPNLYPWCHFFYISCLLLVIQGVISSLLSYFELQTKYKSASHPMLTGGPNGENFSLSSHFSILGERNKGITGKKITKTHKTSNLQSYFNEFQPRNAKKNQENSIKKANENKGSAEPKKNHKKKHPSLHRNTQTPDVFNDRRVKTEGPINEPEIMPTVKKEKKAHAKSISQTGNKSIHSKKQKPTKTTKQSKDKHIKSCEIYGVWKRLPDMPDHTISQTLHGGAKKRRNNSALICNDKFVSKLLNVSLLESELGGSRPVTSDRKSAKSSHSKTFKEYMSSIDLRIIRNIQDDIPIFLGKETTYQDTVRSIMRKNQISLEQLTRKVTTIQRAWRKRQRHSVINTYKRLFQRATDNFFRHDKLEEVSGIDISIQHSHSHSNIDLDIFKNENLAASLKQSQGRSYKDSGQDLQGEDYRMRWIQESQQASTGQLDKEQGLNFGKYRQLVKEEIRSLNKKIGVQGQQKKGLDSKYLLEELMKHNFNKRWIDDESSSLSDRKPEGKEQQLESQMQSVSQEPDSSVNQHTIETYHKQSKNEDEEGQFDDSQIYDRNKYAMVSISEQGKQEGQKPHVSSKIQKIQVDLKTKPQTNSIDVQWINQQLMRDGAADEIIVKNYLDCGLDSFSLQINDKKVSKIKADQEEYEEKDPFSEDQAIGERFQRANIAMIRKRQAKKSQQQQQEQEECVIRIKSKEQGEQLIKNIVNQLLNEFAQDISVILKKCNTGLPQKPKNAPPARPMGIETSFNAIRQFVTKLLKYVQQRQDVMSKITENINKDIGPTSLEILSYLRPEVEDGQSMPLSEEQDDIDEDGLFVIPAELFEDFQNSLEEEYSVQYKKEMGPRIKAYLSFWNRSIFESYNECLDYERPFGVEGKPYAWLKEQKVMRSIPREKLPEYFQRAEQRLLEQTEIVAGIIFQRQDPMLYGGELSEEQMHMMNEQRLSRILASQLLESERSWINLNDELAQLLVQLSRVIEEKLFFEFSGSEFKKVMRHRRMLAEQSYMEQAVEFTLDDLQ